MARARNIKPSFFLNEDLAEIDPLGRLLFIGLWCLADRAGRLEDRPKRIKIELLPCDNADVDALLQALHDRGLILRYSADDRPLIQVINFARHQSPHHQERQSLLPAPASFEANGERVRGRPKANSGFISDKSEASPGAIALIPDSLIPDSKTPSSSAVADGLMDGFATFWKSYPRKVGKQDAMKAWKRLKPDADLVQAIGEGLERAKASEQWQRDRGQFVPHAATWLNGRRWEDEPDDAAAQAQHEQWEGV
ncbi:hypothetical protein [Thiomonas intermedia]|uniref:hypothetical protein n=1 Tax=Thiomonas intermedia TaxID=926 RepID=UPI0009A47E8D|nr:hypothetical protein [Thiomonas intermedia]